MANLGELGRLTDEDSADLLNRVERFQAAWKADGSTGLEWYLPPPGARHRFAVLVQVVAADMERCAPAQLPFRVERYVTLFPEELSTNDMPALLLAAEYQLRHRYTDKPALNEYQRWFPNQFDEMVAHLVQLPPLAPTGPSNQPPLSSVNPNMTPGSGPHLGTIHDGRRSGGLSAVPAPAPAVLSGPLATGHVQVDPVAAMAAAAGAAANMCRLGIPYDVLPTDAPYQLVRRLGSGAFGEVFEALAPGGVKVAVKRIFRSVDHPASKSEKEALEAIKWLSHPFLLKTNAYWVFDDKLVIVMELADGSLTDRIAHHQENGLPGVPPEELIPFFEQAGEALDYLHSQNVSHRDVKPENLLVLKGYAKVADFGLARLHEHTMTVVGNTVGTPAYMAPEMWQQKVSLQSDQYSLAATYVRARIGRHLFDTTVLIDMANSHVNATPDLNPLPDDEKAVVLKALAKKPEDRFGSCLEFAKALRAAVLTPPPPEPEPPKREGRGRAVLQTIGFLLACAMVIGVVIWRTEPRPSDAEKEKPPEKEKEPQTQPVVIVQSPEKKTFVTYPVGWEPVDKDDTYQIGDKHYHRKLTHKVGDQQLVAHLIHATPGADTNPFYMLQYKITNKVFKTEWEAVSKKAPEKVKDLREKELAPGAWEKDENGAALAIEGPDGELPVLGVTLPEALLVADRLNGKIPTHREWQKAAGVSEDGATDGPAGAVLKPPPEFEKMHLSADERTAFAQWKRERFRERNLALGLEKPLPVTDPRAGGDVSRPWNICQLVSNGPEWLAQAPDSTARLESSPLPLGEQYALYVGNSATRDLNIASASDLRKKPREHVWQKVEGLYAGFRIVLIPQ